MDERIAEIMCTLKCHNIPENKMGVFCATWLAFKRGDSHDNLTLPDNVISTVEFTQRKKDYMNDILKVRGNRSEPWYGAICSYQALYELYQNKVVNVDAFYGTVGPLLDELMELLERRATQ
jgi:hypothetical protein